MKKVLIFSAMFLLASVSLSAQVVKGAGLWYFTGLPNVTPSVATGTEVAYSINNKSLFKWNRTTSAWVAVVQDSSITNELQDLILSGDTLSLTLSDSVILMAQYRNHVWEITNLSDTTSITGDIEGDIAYTSTGDTIAFRGASAWLPFTGGGGGGTFNSFNIAGDTGSDIVTDGQTVTIAGGYGINTAETGGTVTVTADTSQLATQSDISGFGTMSSFTVAAGSGTPQTITDGNTLTLSEGYGINTLAAATDNVRTEVDTTQIATQNDISGLPSGSGTNQRIVVWTGTNSQGNSTLLQSATGQTLDENLAFRITGGTTASRPTGAAGMSYYNTSNSWFDMHNGTSWFNPLRSATATGLQTYKTVLWANANGLATGNPYFVWDDATYRLGLGVPAPAYPLDVSGYVRSNGYVIGASLSSAILIVGNDVKRTDYSSLNLGTNNATRMSIANDGIVSIVNLSAVPTKLIGATASNQLGNVTLGAGLSFSSGTLNGAFLPLTLTGATEVNTAGQNLYFRDAAGYPFTFMNANYFLAASSVNNYLDVGSTASNVKVVSDGLIELNSSVNTSLITTGRLLIDGDSTVIDATLPVNTNATHVLVRDAVTKRLEEKAISTIGSGVYLPLSLAGTTEVVTNGNQLTFRDSDSNPRMDLSSGSWQVQGNTSTTLTVQAADIDISAGATGGDVYLYGTAGVVIESDVDANITAPTGSINLNSDEVTLNGTYPVGGSLDSVLVRDATTQRVQVVAQADLDAATTAPSGQLVYGTGSGVTSSSLLTYTSADSSLNINGIKIWTGRHNKAENTAIGVNALLSNTTGEESTAVGYEALKLNTTGSNTALGRRALTSNTAGTGGTALGLSALRDNTTGVENTGAGEAALRFNTIGSQNTAFGKNALYSNIDGIGNIGIGSNAGFGATSADNTLYIGYDPLLLEPSMADSTGVIGRAMKWIRLGDNYKFNTDQTLGSGQDNYVATYDNATGEIGFEAPAAAVVNLSLTGTSQVVELTNSAGTDVVFKGVDIGLTKVSGTKDTLYLTKIEHWGEVSVSGGSTSVTAGTPERPDNDTPGTATGSVSSEFTQSGSTITYVGAAGVAELTASLSFAPTTGGDFLISIFQEGAEIAKSEVRVTTLIGAYETVTLSTVNVAVATNDTFDIRIEPVSGTDTITVHRCNIYSRKIY